MVVDVVLVRPLRGHRYKVTIHRTALMNPMKRRIDIRESKELSTGKAEGRIPIDSEGQTNKQHVNTHTHETSRSTARTMKGATQFFFGWPLFFFPPFPLSRACHGNYPRACHTKLSLIRRGQRKKKKKKIRSSSPLPIQRSLSNWERCSPAALISFQCRAFFFLFLFIKVPLNPFVCAVSQNIIFPSVYSLFTWWNCPCIFCASLPRWRRRAPRHFPLKSGLECGRPCKISHQWDRRKIINATVERMKEKRNNKICRNGLKIFDTEAPAAIGKKNRSRQKV